MKSLSLVLAVVGITVSAQILLKVGMLKVGRMGMSELRAPVESMIYIFSNPYVFSALFLYGLSFMLWTVVLSRIPLSVAYPMLALNYALIPFFAWFFLGERLDVIQWLGVLLVCIGVLLVIQRNGVAA